MPARAADIAAFDSWLSLALESGAVAVVTHRNGDMDTVGSACALASMIGSRARACGVHLSTIARTSQQLLEPLSTPLEQISSVWIQSDQSGRASWVE